MANPAAQAAGGTRAATPSSSAGRSPHSSQPGARLSHSEHQLSSPAADAFSVEPEQSPPAAPSLHQHNAGAALLSLTAVLEATAEESNAAPAVATVRRISSPHQQAAGGGAHLSSPARQQTAPVGGAGRRRSREAAQATSIHAERPRRELGHGGVSGDAVLLENFLSAGLSAGLRASSAEVRTIASPAGIPRCPSPLLIVSRVSRADQAITTAVTHEPRWHAADVRRLAALPPGVHVLRDDTVKTRVRLSHAHPARCVMRMQVQQGPEPNDIFSEPRHSIDIGRPDLAMHDSARLDQPWTVADRNSEPAASFISASHHDNHGQTEEADTAEGNVQTAEDVRDIPADPDVTHSSSGEDFEASAGPRGRDGCARVPPLAVHSCWRMLSVHRSS